MMFVDTPAARRVWERRYNELIFVSSRKTWMPCHQYITDVAYAMGYDKGAPVWFIEEALQIAWVKSWFKFHLFDSFKSAFSTWVVTIFENELWRFFTDRSKYVSVVAEAEFSDMDIADLSDASIAHYDIEERQPDDTEILELLDSRVMVAALRVCRETGTLGPGWQTKTANEAGLSRMRITQLLNNFRKAVANDTIIQISET